MGNSTRVEGSSVVIPRWRLPDGNEREDQARGSAAGDGAERES